MSATQPNNLDNFLNKIINRYMDKLDEKTKLIRLPLSLTIQEAKEVIALLEKLRA